MIFVDSNIPMYLAVAARADVEHARDTLLRYQTLSARDALHVAVMARHDIAQLMSFDRGFDACPGIERLA